MFGSVDLLITEPVVAAFSVSRAFMFLSYDRSYSVSSFGWVSPGVFSMYSWSTRSPLMILIVQTDEFC